MTLAAKNIADVQLYWDNSPCFIKRSSAPKNSKQFMDETEARKYKSEPHIPGFAEFGKWPGKKVLEIGCGIGIDTVNFARAGAMVTAIDLSGKSLNIAQKRAQIADVDIEFIRGNAENLLGADIATLRYFNAYDLVYAFGSIHHSPNPSFALHSARWSMKNNGTLKLMVYNKYSWKALWILLKYGHGKFWKFSELVAKYSEAQTGCPITHVYSKRSIRAMLERNGFKVRKMEIDHIFPYRIEDYKNYRYVREWYFRWMPAKMFRWLEKHFGWHLLIEAVA
jgi:2-polyprenyl-3-methyl-5-hydroxy-6-metoxy-1,4-benzoquinol methylase